MEKQAKWEEYSKRLMTVFLRLGLPTIIAFGVWLFARWKFQLSCPIAVLLGMEGTLLLAFAISFPPGPNRLKWWLFDSMNYGNMPSFSYINFYLGLALLVVGIVMAAIP